MQVERQWVGKLQSEREPKMEEKRRKYEFKEKSTGGPEVYLEKVAGRVGVGEEKS